MNAFIQPSEFPVNALPITAQNATLEIQKNTGAPLNLIVPSVLAAMSTAIQGGYDIQIMDGLKSVTGIWLLSLAESGERKTAVEKKTFSSIREFEQERAELYRTKMDGYDTDILAWQTGRKAILKSITKATIAEESTDQYKQRLVDHALRMPKKPKLVKLIYNDATQSAIKKGLSENWPSIAIISDEGAGIFNGQAISNLSLPNSIWSGSPITVDRADQQFTVQNPRLTMCLQTQPGPLRRYLERKGDEARDTGFLARFLISYPQSTQGQRYIYSPTTSWQHVPEFNARIRVILEMSIGPDDEPVAKHLLTFTPEAQARWIAAYNEIESLMNPGQYFSNVRDYAAKIAENLARLAAIFHVFEGEEGPISLNTLERAYAASRWFANEFVRLFSPEYQIPQEQIDATKLEIWIAQQIMRTGQILNFKRNALMQNAPEDVRKKARLYPALEILFGLGRINFFMQGKTTWISPSHNYFTQQQVHLLVTQKYLAR